MKKEKLKSKLDLILNSVKPLNLKSDSLSLKELAKKAEKPNYEINGCGLCKLVGGSG